LETTTKAACPVGAELLYQLVVEAKNEQGWHPLANKESFVPLSQQFEREGGYSHARSPQDVEWQFSGLFFRAYGLLDLRNVERDSS
jgi:hypothetical protein